MTNEKRILIVDDEPNVNQLLGFVLTKEGYNVSTATNGEEAMAKIRETKPSLLILDVMMPKKNGYEVCQEVKNAPDLNDIYIIMLTAKGQEVDREKGNSLVADEFVTKPFSPLKIVTRVKEVLA